MKKLIPLFLMLTVLEAQSTNLVTVQTDKVNKETAAATMPVSGVVLSREDASIAAELDGRITWIAEVGDRVTAGSRLAQLDTHLLELDIRTRESEVQRLQANLDWLRRQTERLAELATSNNTAHSELDETRSRTAMLEHELSQARVGVERSRYDLERSTIVAPFDGVVVSRESSIGEYTVTGRSLLRLVNPEAAEISVTAPLRLARYVIEGDSVQVANSESSGNALIRSLVAVGDLRSHMMELRLAPGDNWLIGEAVTVTLPASEQRLLTTVPRDALVLRDHSNYVFRVAENETAERVVVEVGSGFGDRIAVKGKLKPGDSVVVRGAERLRNGQQVEILGSAVTMR